MSHQSHFNPIADALAAHRIGTFRVTFFAVSAVTPLTVIAGIVTTGFAITGLTGVPAAFAATGLMLALFAVGYVAMGRRIENPAGFYAFVTHGLGRPLGVGAAWVALVAYNLLQVGLYGAIGVAAAPLLEAWLGITTYWWIVALFAWGLTTLLGLANVKVNGVVVGVLLAAEIVLLAVYSVANLLHPAGPVDWSPLDPSTLIGPQAGVALNLAVLGFVGFEATVMFSRYAKGAHTISRATKLTLFIIGALYTFGSFALVTSVGVGSIVERSTVEGPELVFNLAARQLGHIWADLGHILFATSVLAALISFHAIVARYALALGLERVLPATLGRIGPRSGAPWVASLVQSGVALAVIVTYAVNGWDPLIHLFFWAGTSGGLGVLLLLWLTALAIVAYFARRRRRGDSVWTRLVAPMLAVLALTYVAGTACLNFEQLLGVAPDSPLPLIVICGFVVTLLLGMAWAGILRRTRPAVYVSIGLGAQAATHQHGLDSTGATVVVPRGVGVR